MITIVVTELYETEKYKILFDSIEPVETGFENWEFIFENSKGLKLFVSLKF